MECECEGAYEFSQSSLCAHSYVGNPAICISSLRVLQGCDAPHSRSFYAEWNGGSVKLYLSGPMTGYPNLNYEAFHENAKKLRNWGHEVWSPAECKENEGQPWHTCMERDFHAVLAADAVAVMDGWETSRGARSEVFVALVCRHPIFNADTMWEIFPIAQLCVVKKIPPQLQNVGDSWVFVGGKS